LDPECAPPFAGAIRLGFHARGFGGDQIGTEKVAGGALVASRRKSSSESSASASSLSRAVPFRRATLRAPTRALRASAFRARGVEFEPFGGDFDLVLIGARNISGALPHFRNHWLPGGERRRNREHAAIAFGEQARQRMPQ